MSLHALIDDDIALIGLSSKALYWTACGAISFVANIWMASPAAAASFSTSSNVLSNTSLTQSSLDHESTHVIANALYARPSSTYSQMELGGAFGSNADYAAGLSEEWFIEEQRRGSDALISGLIHENETAISAGFDMFDWGFSQQLTDGSFGGTGDAFHSTSMFVESVAYSLLTLEVAPNASQYADTVNLYIPMLHSAARWMIQDDVWERGLSNNSPYSHRSYIVAGALGLTGKLTGDQELLDYSEGSIEVGLAQQWDNGVNPELGGHDSSYQMTGANYAMRWLVHLATETVDTLTNGVSTMIGKALAWEESRILETGEISVEDNTRTPGLEETRSGQGKNLNHREVMKGFAYWSSVTGDARWDDNARDVGRYYYRNDEKVLTALNTPVVVPPQEPKSVPEPSSVLGLGLLGFLCFSRRGFKTGRRS